MSAHHAHRLIMRTSRTAILCAILLTAAACHTARPVSDLQPPKPPSQEPLTPPSDPRAIMVFNTHTQRVVPWDELVMRAASSDFVLIGEQHNHEMGLAVAAALFEDILDKRPGSTALSMEWFYRDQQGAIDDYFTGVIDEKAFFKAAKRTSRNYPPGHRAMVESARNADRPVYAANTPWRYTRIASKEGFDRLRTLTSLQRANFAIPESIIEGPYRDRFWEVMSGGPDAPGSTHTPDADADAPTPEERDARIARSYRAQNLWDATMADTCVHAVNLGAQPVVHVVGQFHTDQLGGLTERIRRARPQMRVMTLSVVDDWSGILKSDDADRADMVLYVGPSPGHVKNGKK